jgi:rod shape determining protein RodA
MVILGVTTIILLAKSITLLWVVGILATITLFVVYFVKKNTQAIITVVVIGVISTAFSYSVSFAFNKILKQYQRDRIELILGLKEDRKGAGYNLEQSRIAVGAGQMSGRGFLEGTQTKMGFVPEQHTDFIFCTIAEEWGFIGVLLFFAMYFGLLLRIANLAERQSTVFGRVLGYSVASIIFIHVAINIGMTIGLVPVIGIPLPFISFGGSSLWAFTLLLFTFLKVDEKRR